MSRTMNNRPISIFISDVLIVSLLLLNFTVVALKGIPGEVNVEVSAEDSSASRPVVLCVLLRDAHDSQDPETTACRYAFRQVIRMGEPLPALLALAGILVAGLSAFSRVKSAFLCGACVPRNAERIAAFLHDLSAAL